MAKVAEKPTLPKRRRLLSWVLWGFVGILAMAAGVAVPFLVSLKSLPVLSKVFGPATGQNTAYVDKFDVVVNIKEGNGNRFLKVRILLVMDGPQKVNDDLIDKHKPFLKDWLISYLSDKSFKDLQGKAAQNRIRREIKVYFNDRISPDGSEKISDILFAEFQIGV